MLIPIIRSGQGPKSCQNENPATNSYGENAFGVRDYPAGREQILTGKQSSRVRAVPRAYGARARGGLGFSPEWGDDSSPGSGFTCDYAELAGPYTAPPPGDPAVLSSPGLLRWMEHAPMSTFPPIADYAFLSDCENNCLVAPDGSIEWLSLPRPDSPSVFGALLDRTAGTFRFGPANAMVPDHRRYVPGTMVLETTWHTPTGWLVVNDLFVVRPVERRGAASWLPASPRVGAGVGTILRTATCISGKVDVAANVPADVRLRVRAKLLELRHRQLPLDGGAPARRGRIPQAALQLPARPDRGPRLRPVRPQ